MHEPGESIKLRPSFDDHLIDDVLRSSSTEFKKFLRFFAKDLLIIFDTFEKTEVLIDNLIKVLILNPEDIDASITSPQLSASQSFMRLLNFLLKNSQFSFPAFRAALSSCKGTILSSFSVPEVVSDEYLNRPDIATASISGRDQSLIWSQSTATSLWSYYDICSLETSIKLHSSRPFVHNLTQISFLDFVRVFNTSSKLSCLCQSLENSGVLTLDQSLEIEYFSLAFINLLPAVRKLMERLAEASQSLGVSYVEKVLLNAISKLKSISNNPNTLRYQRSSYLY